MEAISLHARFTDLAWQRYQLRDRRVPAMKARVEAGNLRHVRAIARRPLRWPPGCAVDAMGPVEPVRIARARTCRVTIVGLGIPRTTMNHAVSDAQHSRAAILRAKPGSQRIEGRAAITTPVIQLVFGEDSRRRASLAENRGDVPMPSIWPRASSRQFSASGRRNTQNFRLDEPALSTSA